MWAGRGQNPVSLPGLNLPFQVTGAGLSGPVPVPEIYPPQVYFQMFPKQEESSGPPLARGSAWADTGAASVEHFTCL